MNLKNFNLFDKKALSVAALSVAALLSSCSKNDMTKAPSNTQDASQAAAADAVKDRYIVTMKPEAASSVNLSQIANGKDAVLLGDDILAKENINVKLSEDETFSGFNAGFIMHLTDDQLAKLKNDPRILSIESDQVVDFITAEKETFSAARKGHVQSSTTTKTTTSSSSGTTAYGFATVADATANGQVTPWGVTAIGGSGSVSGKTAWIIDSGIDFNQPDLNVDQSRSKSFLSSTDGGLYYSPTDEFGHGTEIAGVIGAKDNTIGTKGVAPGVTLVSLKALNRYGKGTLGELVRAINWVYTYGHAGDVVNISIGGTASTTVDNAVKAVAAKGIFIAIASGNGYVNCSNMSPQRVIATNVFTVGAVDNTGTFASYSNYGTPVKYSAPGTSIYTTMKGGGYGYASGTSFAAPHMAGVLLLNSGKPSYSAYAKNDPDATPSKIAHR
jgi:subtilisin family serine protease